MKNLHRAGLAALLFSTLAADAAACGACADKALAAFFPLIAPLLALPLLWLVVMFGVVGHPKDRNPSECGKWPDQTRLCYACLAAAFAFFGLWILTSGSFLGPPLAITAFWMLHLLVGLLRNIPKRRNPRARKCLKIYGAFLLAATLLLAGLILCIHLHPLDPMAVPEHESQRAGALSENGERLTGAA